MKMSRQFSDSGAPLSGQLSAQINPAQISLDHSNRSLVIDQLIRDFAQCWCWAWILSCS